MADPQLIQPIQPINPVQSAQAGKSVTVLPPDQAIPMPGTQSPMLGQQSQGMPLPQGMQDIHDIEAPMQVGIDPFIIQMAVGGAIFILILVLCYFLYRYWRKRRMAKKTAHLLMLPPPLPPKEAALRELDAATHLKKTYPRLYYFRLTALLKTFIGKSFKINAPEMTTQELTSAINSIIQKKSVHRQVMNSVKGLFDTASMIKYAAVTPNIDQMEADERLTRKFIDQVTEDLAGNSDDGIQVSQKRSVDPINREKRLVKNNKANNDEPSDDNDDRFLGREEMGA